MRVRAIPRRALRVLDNLPPAPEADRPRTRGDCVDGPRPCPWYGCRYHLGLDLTANPPPKQPTIHLAGQVTAEIELLDLPETCALDVAARGEHDREQVGVVMGLYRESVRQIELQALEKMRGGMHEDLLE